MLRMITRLSKFSLAEAYRKNDFRVPRDLWKSIAAGCELEFTEFNSRTIIFTLALAAHY